MLNTAFNKALRTKVVDGKVYVDLEQLVELIFDIANQSAMVASRLNDPGLGVMTLGVSTLGQALDGVLELQKQALGVGVQSKPTERSQSDSDGVAETA